MIRTGQIFFTQRGDICMKLFYAAGAPHSAVGQENVRAADIGNGDIYKLPPTELVVAGPKMYCLYQLHDENKELKRKLFTARVGLSNILASRPSLECPDFYAELENLQRIAKETLAMTELV